MVIGPLAPAHRAAAHGQAAWVKQHNFSAAAARVATATPAQNQANNVQKTAAVAQMDDSKFEVKIKGRADRSLFPQNTVAVTFDDVVDLINPLHHLPVIGDLYRSITGDKISGMAKVGGAFIFGGIAGGFVAHAQTLYESSKGESVGDTLLAAVETEAPPARAANLAAVRKADPADTSFVSRLPKNAAALLKADPAQAEALLANVAGKTLQSAAPQADIPTLMERGLARYRAAQGL